MFIVLKSARQLSVIGFRKMSANASNDWRQNSNHLNNVWNTKQFGPARKIKPRKSKTIFAAALEQDEDAWKAVYFDKLSRCIEKIKIKTSPTSNATTSDLHPDPAILKNFTKIMVITDTEVLPSQADLNIGLPSGNETGPNDANLVSRIDLPLEQFPLLNVNRSDKFDSEDTFHLSYEKAVAANGSDRQLPSVTSILKATMPPEQRLILERWEEKLVAEIGREKFDEMRQATLSRGKNLHSAIQTYFETGELECARVIHEEEEAKILSLHLQSLAPVIRNCQRPAIVLESQVIHPDLGYKGYIDCVTSFGDKQSLVLIDWKTSGKPKKRIRRTFDTPLQIAAYAGAINFDPRYKGQIREAMAVIVYNDGNPADVLKLSPKTLESYWRIWLHRLKEYKSLNLSQTSMSPIE